MRLEPGQGGGSNSSGDQKPPSLQHQQGQVYPQEAPFSCFPLSNGLPGISPSCWTLCVNFSSTLHRLWSFGTSCRWLASSCYELAIPGMVGLSGASASTPALPPALREQQLERLGSESLRSCEKSTNLTINTLVLPVPGWHGNRGASAAWCLGALHSGTSHALPCDRLVWPHRSLPPPAPSPASAVVCPATCKPREAPAHCVFCSPHSSSDFSFCKAKNPLPGSLNSSKFPVAMLGRAGRGSA